MLRYVEALSIILRQAEKERALRGAGETVALDASLGCVSAAQVLSPCAVPPFDNSSMDGFALRSEWTRGASARHPVHLPVRGSSVAGDLPAKAGLTPCAWEIMTGAPFPEGLDAAVRIEDVTVLRDRDGAPQAIEVGSEAEPNQFRRGAGEDFAAGSPVLARGASIEPEHLLALASLGIRELSVERRPRVAVLSTGRELASLETEPLPGQIRNSTAHFLRAAIPRLGAEYVDGGTVTDDPRAFRRAVESLLTRDGGAPDVLLTTGAVSIGKHDFIQDTLTEMGASHFFHKVAIRPGKPLLFSKLASGPILLGLPGNPVSTVVGLRFFVEPYLRALVGREQERPLRGRLSHTVAKPEGLRCFFKARFHVSAEQEQPSVSVLPGQMSFLVRPLLEATGWAVLPEEEPHAHEGSIVDFYPPYSGPYDWSQAASAPRPSSAHDRGCCR